MSSLIVRARNRAFHWFFLASRPMTLGARVALFDGAGRVFLVRHTYISGWHLPGGGVDAGETIAQAAARELREEAGHEPTGPLVLFAAYKNAQSSPRDHVLLYRCDSGRAIDGFRPDRSEIAESGFHRVDDLPAATSAATRRRLAELAGAAEPDPYW